MAALGIYHGLGVKSCIVIVGELIPEVVRAIGSSTPSIGITYHGTPSEEAGHALRCTAGAITLDKLELEHRFVIVVDVVVTPKVVIVVEQLVVAFLDYLEGSLLGEVEIVLVASATIEVGSDVGAIISSACGQACHGEVETAQHTVCGVFVDATNLSLRCWKILGSIFHVSDGKLDDILTRLCRHDVIVDQVGGVGIDDTASPECADVPVSQTTHEASLGNTLYLGSLAHA